MSIHAELGAGKQGDPSVYAEFSNTKRAILFDCGESLLPHEKLRKITDIFVSHTHIDHFIGFDRILRLNITEDKTLRIFGPAHMIDHVEGKLCGYTWNLTEKLKLKIEAYEIHGDYGYKSTFNSIEKFKGAPREKINFKSNQLFADELFSASYAILDHYIPSIAYAIQEKPFFNINKTRMDELGLKAGTWIQTLKEMVIRNEPESTPIDINGKNKPLGFLKNELLIAKDVDSVGYITDTIFSVETCASIQKLFPMPGVTLFCEASFTNEDIQRATNTHHLTTGQCGKIAMLINAKTLIPFHISKRYADVMPSLEEIKNEFKELDNG